jgi:hypothetical protein
VDWANYRVGYAWCHGFTRAKNFHVDAIGVYAPGPKSSTHVLKECGGSTQVEVCVARHTKFVEHGYAEASSGIKIQTQTILGARPAVHYSTAALRQRLHKAA